jgi:hypothetical protein
VGDGTPPGTLGRYAGDGPAFGRRVDGSRARQSAPACLVVSGKQPANRPAKRIERTARTPWPRAAAKTRRAASLGEDPSRRRTSGPSRVTRPRRRPSTHCATGWSRSCLGHRDRTCPALEATPKNGPRGGALAGTARSTWRRPAAAPRGAIGRSRGRRGGGKRVWQGPISQGGVDSSVCRGWPVPSDVVEGLGMGTDSAWQLACLQARPSTPAPKAKRCETSARETATTLRWQVAGFRVSDAPCGCDPWVPRRRARPLGSDAAALRPPLAAHRVGRQAAVPMVWPGPSRR